MSITPDARLVDPNRSNAITHQSTWQHLLNEAKSALRDSLAKKSFARRARRLRPQLLRFYYPSVLAVRLGRASGVDGLFLDILNAQFVIESGTAVPTDLSLMDLAISRAELLPRALARKDARLYFEQQVVAPLHVLLVQGNREVRAWVFEHHNDTWTRFRRWIKACVKRQRCECDPVEEFRLDPNGFSLLVWKNLWALPELEEVLNVAVPPTEPTKERDQTDSNPVDTAVDVAVRLDTDHLGWAQPGNLLQGLHAEIRAAKALAPDHVLTRHVFQRVQHAIKRLEDFEAAYEVGTAQDPLPDWVSAALDAVDAIEFRGHDNESVTKVVRRMACRLWTTGLYRFPGGQLPQISANRNAQSSQPVAPSMAPPIATPPPPQFADYEVATGF